MATENELQRLAAAMNALRPDWPTSSLFTLLRSKHAGRAYADLAVAAVAVSVDPNTKTPARLSEAGPWWSLVRQDVTPQVGPGSDPRCEKPGHEHERARHCRCCRAEALAEPDDRDPDVRERQAGNAA